MNPSKPRIGAIIMAAGKGTRLKSEWPKVLHTVCGRPMLAYVLDACREAGISSCIVIVGHGKDQVMRAFADDRAITWVEQNPQLGTGHAVMVCRSAFAEYFDHVLVLAGDGPLIRGETLRALLDQHMAEHAAATLATAVIDDPTGYGRIVRDAGGRMAGIVEHKDATPEQRAIREVNPSYYCFRVADLLRSLDQLQPNNAQGEYYITDAIGGLIAGGARVGAVTSVPPEDIFSINSRHELALVSGVLRDRVVRRWQNDGVTVVDPASTWIDARATIGADTLIEPFVVIDGPVRIGRNCRICSFTRLTGDAALADGTVYAGGAGGAAR